MDHIAIDLGGRKSRICVRNAQGTVLEEHWWVTNRLGDYLKKRTVSRVVLETSAEAFAVPGQATRPRSDCGASHLGEVLGSGGAAGEDGQEGCPGAQRGVLSNQPTVGARPVEAVARMEGVVQRPRVSGDDPDQTHQPRSRFAADAGEPSPLGKRGNLCAASSGETVEQRGGIADGGGARAQPHRAAPPEHRRCRPRGGGDHRSRAALSKSDNPSPASALALRFLAALDEVSRFHGAHALQSYLGLTPGENSSSTRERRTSITKAGSPTVRWLLVQAAWCALRTRRNDPMVQWALEVAKRRGPQVAAVALSRKLAGILYAILRDGTTYQSNQGAQAASPIEL